VNASYHNTQQYQKHLHRRYLASDCTRAVSLFTAYMYMGTQKHLAMRYQNIHTETRDGVRDITTPFTSMTCMLFLQYTLQGGPAKVKPTYIFAGDIILDILY